MLLHKISFLILVSAAEITIFGTFLVAAVIHISRQALKTAGRTVQKLGRR